jgi:hypothetical protein
MKRLIVTFMFIVAFFPCALLAQDQDFGLGLILGEPTGISFKKWTGNKIAIDGAVAWSFSGEDSLHLHADYLVHSFNLITVERGRLPLYFGLGARLKLGDPSRFGIRIPVGVSYIFEEASLDIFFELVPILDLAPDTDFKIAGGIGIRYYF